MSNNLVVTMRDVRSAKLCARGVKTWFDSHGLDFRDFLANGLPASQVEALNDALAVRVLEQARKRVGEQDGR